VREYVGGHARVNKTWVGSRDAGQTPTPAPSLEPLGERGGLAPASAPLPSPSPDSVMSFRAT
jgi:hypothetical protein